MNTVSKDTEQVIIGGLLGDAWFTKREKNANLNMSHCPKQLDYLRWKVSFFEEDCLTTPRGIKSILSNKKRYLQYNFYTQQLPVFNTYRTLFYPDGKKVVTRHILNKLEPLGLAVWFMDDGSRTIDWHKRKDGLFSIRRRRMEIATDSFTYDEHLIMQKYFDVVWDISVNIHKSKNNWKLHINSTNAIKLIDIIKPHIVPCMQYKIDLKYNVTHPVNSPDDDIV